MVDGAGRPLAATGGAHGGTLSLGDTTIRYLGVEPIDVAGVGESATISLSDDSDEATLASGAAAACAACLAVSGGGFALLTFSLPSTSVSIDAGAGRDSVVLTGTITLAGAALTVRAERIAVASDAAITSAGAIALAAAEVVTAIALQGCTARCADAAVDIAGLLEGSDVDITASAGLTPAAAGSFGLTAFATILMNGAAWIRATHGNAKLSSISRIMAALGELTARLVTSSSNVSVGGSSGIESAGTLTVASASDVDLDVVASTDASSPWLTVVSNAVATVDGSSSLTAAGDLTVSADSRVDVSDGSVDTPAGISVTQTSLATITTIGSVSGNRVEVRRQSSGNGAHISAAAAGPGSDRTLTSADLSPVADAAKAAWTAELPDADFAGVTFTISDLAGMALGQTTGSLVTIDADGAGWGWSIFGGDPSQRMDLLTVLLHELGHVLGYAHGDGLMADTLSAGETRSVPSDSTGTTVSVPADWLVVAPDGVVHAIEVKVADGNIDLTLDGVISSKSVSSVAKLAITGGNLADTLTIDSSVVTSGIQVLFDGRAGVDRIRGPPATLTWTLTAPGTGTVGSVSFTGVEDLEGAVGNEDTFVFEAAGSLTGTVDGGDAGYDTLVIHGGDYAVVTSTVTGPQSGVIALDSQQITYAGLEPILISTGSADRRGLHPLLGGCQHLDVGRGDDSREARAHERQRHVRDDRVRWCRRRRSPSTSAVSATRSRSTSSTRCSQRRR